jgi:flavodoxin
MKIGIIIYSKTGNTYEVVNRIKERIGTEATIEKIEIEEDASSNNRNVELKKIPKIDNYDIVIFASPVQAFSLAPAMNAYLEQVISLKNKKVGCLVTEFFPYPWMGGNRAIKQMKKLIEAKEGTVEVTGIVNWSNKKRDKMIDDVVNKFCNYIK